MVFGFWFKNLSLGFEVWSLDAFSLFSSQRERARVRVRVAAHATRERRRVTCDV